MQRKNESLLSRGIITQSGEICKGKINLVSGAITQPFAEMVWVSTGGDKETINRLTDIFVSMNTPADRGKLFKIIKLTASVLQAAIKQVLAKMKAQRGKQPRGKQTLKQLMKQNTGISNIEITDSNIKDFTATAKKYGIDFALKKDVTETPPRYLVFFKGRDADVLTAAFKEFSAKKLTKEKKPSIKKLLATMKEKAAARNAQREKVNKKDRGLTL